MTARFGTRLWVALHGALLLQVPGQSTRGYSCGRETKGQAQGRRHYTKRVVRALLRPTVEASGRKRGKMSTRKRLRHQRVRPGSQGMSSERSLPRRPVQEVKLVNREFLFSNTQLCCGACQAPGWMLLTARSDFPLVPPDLLACP